jgi:thioesterase domain-containing protein
VVFLSDDDEASLIESRWAALLTGRWRSARVPGGHIAMLEQANIAVAAAVLREELDEVGALR